MTDTLPSDTPVPVGTARRALQMTTHWQDFDLAVVTVTGELDATNTDILLDYALSKVVLCQRMVLDLTDIDFFGCAGYTMLKTLEYRCILADVVLTLLTGAPVRRVLKVCEYAARHGL
ncbi:MAG: STAS domain-containing protein [Mycolicibacterium neoaurum]|uniref:STAS domain-containing protein n=1 Tax=Mycolicibacterium neoaurum TaxID=1795 RepID=UPI001BD10D37|nr:STAS domain-containing protein [Mycolicibacterium neoaurum]QVI28216.1 STAS domain-containing protein [Mycolicibacterium neoaurum]